MTSKALRRLNLYFNNNKMFLKLVIISFLTIKCKSQQFLARSNFHVMSEVFSWKQLTYDLNGVLYSTDSNYERIAGSVYFEQELEDNEKFFIQYNNVPVGFEVDSARNRLFITVPRRRYGIPSTLNYVSLNASAEPTLKPYPSVEKSKELVSVYRPRIDACNRLWIIDSGLQEIPNDRKQLKPPAIIIYDLNTNEEIMKHELDSSVLKGDRTSGGLTSITVDVTSSTCDNAFAYINDLATETMIVFSLKERASWRIEHPTFGYDVGATNFSIDSNVITWKDGLFSIALTEPDSTGQRRAYYHPFIATQEFSVTTDVLRNRNGDFDKSFKLEGVRGAWSQSGSHDYHAGTRTLHFANVAQNAITCWNIEKPLKSANVAITAQDKTKLVYVSDLKVVGDDVWVLANQMPTFIYGKLNYENFNFFLLRGSVKRLIRGTSCDKK